MLLARLSLHGVHTHCCARAHYEKPSDIVREPLRSAALAPVTPPAFLTAHVRFAESQARENYAAPKAALFF